MVIAETGQARILLLGYYAATAVFLLLDYGLGVNVRVAFLEPYPWLRAAYYGLLVVCFGLMVRRPDWTVLVSAFESLVTLLALIFTLAIRSILVTDIMLETGTGVVSRAEILNFLISGSAAYVAWARGLEELRRGPRPGP